MVVDELDVVDDVLLLETVDVVRLRSVRSRRDTILSTNSEIIGVEQVEKNDWNLTNKRWYTGGIVGIE